MSWVGKSAADWLRWDSWCVSERWAAHSKCFVFLRPVVCSLHECFMCLSPFWDKPAVLFLCPNGDQDLWAAADCCYAQSRQNPLTSSYCLFCVSRSGRSSVGLPGRGVRSTSQHRALQQPPLRQEPQQSRLPACGQLSAKCSGPTSGPARGLPNELRPLAGEGSLLQTYFLGRTATVRLDHRQHSCSLFLFFLFFKQFQSGVQMKHHQCSHWSTELFSEQNIMLHILYRLKVADGFYSQFPAWRSVVGGPAKCFWCLNFCLLRNFALLWFLCSF